MDYTGRMSDTLPDYDRMAADFDRYLPLIEPVGRAVLDHLPPLPEGARVLDVACGTGEPGLTLARRSPGVQVLGADAASGMVDVARAKARREDLSNIRFEVMPFERLAVADGSMEAVISRFGLLLFGDAAASARELSRVLRPTGSFSLAVWDDSARNTLVSAVFASLRPRLPAGALQPFDRLSDLAAPGLREGLLRDAGLTVVGSAWFEWSYPLGTPENLTLFITGPGMFTSLLSPLEGSAREQVCSEVLAAMERYRADDGYHIPHACRLLWGHRDG